MWYSSHSLSLRDGHNNYWILSKQILLVRGEVPVERTSVLSSTPLPGAGRPNTKSGYNSEHELLHGNQNKVLSTTIAKHKHREGKPFLQNYI